MNALCLRMRGGPEALALGQIPPPTPAEGEILVRVHAACVTPTELDWAPTWTTRTGGPRAFPVIPGHEFSGEIAAVCPGVTDLAPGDAVFGMSDWFGDGAQADLCVARAIDVAIKPRSIDHVAAAATPISALTAWQGLIARAHLAPGDRVLVHGAAGGVGLFAIQIARARGAHVIGTASAHNLELVRGLGAHEVIDHRAQRFDELVRDVDVVFDAVGGETLVRSWGVLGPKGRLVTIAASEETTSDERIRDAFFIVEPDRAQLASIAARIDAGELRVLVGAVFPLAAGAEAYRHKPLRGKVVFSITGSG